MSGPTLATFFTISYGGRAGSLGKIDIAQLIKEKYEIQTNCLAPEHYSLPCTTPSLSKHGSVKWQLPTIN